MASSSLSTAVIPESWPRYANRINITDDLQIDTLLLETKPTQSLKTRLMLGSIQLVKTWRSEIEHHSNSSQLKIGFLLMNEWEFELNWSHPTGSWLGISIGMTGGGIYWMAIQGNSTQLMHSSLPLSSQHSNFKKLQLIRKWSILIWLSCVQIQIGILHPVSFLNSN